MSSVAVLLLELVSVEPVETVQVFVSGPVTNGALVKETAATELGARLPKLLENTDAGRAGGALGQQADDVKRQIGTVVGDGEGVDDVAPHDDRVGSGAAPRWWRRHPPRARPP